MKTLLLLFLALSLPAVAGLPTPEEEIAKLKAEKEKRMEAATRSVNDWYALELSKKERLAAGKDGGAFAKERMALLLCSVPSWTWERQGSSDTKMVFRDDGTGSHTNTVFRWSATEDGVKMELPDGRKCELKMDAKTLVLSGVDFDQRSKVVSRAKNPAS